MQSCKPTRLSCIECYINPQSKYVHFVAVIDNVIGCNCNAVAASLNFIRFEFSRGDEPDMMRLAFRMQNNLRK